MRSLVVLVAFAVPVHAAEKDEDKAKEAAAAFLKAIVAKDIDALMKTVDAPFTFGAEGKELKTVTKDELKDGMVKVLKETDPEQARTFKAGKVYDMPALSKYAKENNLPGFAEKVEKLVGKTGYAVALVTKDGEAPLLLIRMKEGKAFVAGIPK